MSRGNDNNRIVCECSGNMIAASLHHIACLDMFPVQDGDFVNDFDFAEDAYTYECTLNTEGQGYGMVPETKTQMLKEPLRVGAHILCTGTPIPELPTFSVNVFSNESDILVTFSVRLPQRYVVRNTRKNLNWGKEETTSHRSFPFREDSAFILEMLVTETSWMFAVDGEHYCSYAHRSPSVLDVAASQVEVVGVREATITLSQIDHYPALAPPATEVPMFGQGVNLVADCAGHDWRANIDAVLPNGIPEGYELVIEGRFRMLMQSASVELCEAGACEWPAPTSELRVELGAGALALGWGAGGAGGAAGARRAGAGAAALGGGRALRLRVARSGGEWQVWAQGALAGTLPTREAERVRVLRLRGDLLPRRMFLGPCSA